MFRRAILILVAMAAGLAAFPDLAFAKRVALVIANGQYAHATSLKNPASDARLIAASLKKAGFDSVDMRLDLGKSALEAALQAFGAKAEGAEVAMVYYAGHGIEAGGQNYLIPVDAKLARDRDLEIEATRLDTLLLMGEGAKLRIVVLDACRNNPFVASMQRTLRNRAVGRGLAAVEPEGETLVVYAAKAGATAADGEGANSPFAEAMAKRLPERGLEISLLFRAIRDDVLAKTGRTQEPFTYGSLSGTAFYFVPPGAQGGVAAPVQTAQPVITPPAFNKEATEALYWQGTLAANSEAGFRDYLARYPQGQFANVAKQNVQRFVKPKSVPQVTAQPAPSGVSGSSLGKMSSGLGLGNLASIFGKAPPASVGTQTARTYAFTPSPAIRSRISSEFVRELKTTNEQMGTVFGQVLASQDMFKLIDGEVSKYGLSTNNLADTLAIFLSTMADASRGVETDTTRTQGLAAQRQMVALLASNPSAQQMTAAERQEISDAFVLYTTFVAVLFEAAKAGGPQGLKDFAREMATLSQSTLGFDTRDIYLTDQGFERRGQ